MPTDPKTHVFTPEGEIRRLAAKAEREAKRAAMPQRLPKTVLMERRVVDLWREHCGQFDSFQEFATALGPANSFTYEWLRQRRSKNPAFAERLDELSARFGLESKAKPASAAIALAPVRWPDLEAWKGLFLERYREEKDRNKAAALTNRTLAEIETALEADAAFAAGYAEIFREVVVAAEDSALRDASVGRGGARAQAVLETQSSLLSKMGFRAGMRGGAAGSGTISTTDYDVAATRERAKELAAKYGIAPRQAVPRVEEPPRP